MSRKDFFRKIKEYNRLCEKFEEKPRKTEYAGKGVTYPDFDSGHAKVLMIREYLELCERYEEEAETFEHESGEVLPKYYGEHARTLRRRASGEGDAKSED